MADEGSEHNIYNPASSDDVADDVVEDIANE